MIGKCKLCLREDVSLMRSHYIPAAVYRSLNDLDGSGKKRDPFHITNGRSFQSSSQARAYLLCGDCEMRFTKGGEDWFFRHNLKSNGSFKLLDLLMAGQPSAQKQGVPTALYEVDRFPAINADALVYFATSVFWRGSIYGWNSDGSVPVNLYSYSDQFRRYLLGERAFPQHAALVSIVRPPSPTDRVTYGPVGESQGSNSHYRCALPGFAFILSIGRKLTEQNKRYCLVRGLGRPLVLTSIADEHISQETRRVLGFRD